jgi:hypothetical protein
VGKSVFACASADKNELLTTPFNIKKIKDVGVGCKKNT